MAETPPKKRPSLGDRIRAFRDAGSQVPNEPTTPTAATPTAQPKNFPLEDEKPVDAEFIDGETPTDHFVRTQNEQAQRERAQQEAAAAEQRRMNDPRNVVQRHPGRFIVGGALAAALTTAAVLGEVEAWDQSHPADYEPDATNGNSAAPVVPGPTPEVTTASPVPTQTSSPSPTAVPTHEQLSGPTTQKVTHKKFYFNQQEGVSVNGVYISAQLRADPDKNTIEVANGTAQNWANFGGSDNVNNNPGALISDGPYAPTEIDITDLKTGEITVRDLDVTKLNDGQYISSQNTDKQSFETDKIKLGNDSYEVEVVFDDPANKGTNPKKFDLGGFDLG